MEGPILIDRKQKLEYFKTMATYHNFCDADKKLIKMGILTAENVNKRDQKTKKKI